MLLTLTYNGKDASDLGYLLFKNPHRPQKFELNFGNAYVFYPELSAHRATAALLLDIDPIQLTKGKENTNTAGMFDYLNDRPYVSSSFMSTAISRVFGTAMSGRCDSRPELADTPLELTAYISMLPCRGDKEKLKSIFEPLGYSVYYTTSSSDEEFPEWGESPYVDLTLKGSVKLKDLLNHLYVLLPVFDRRKHYWINRDEIDKLLTHAADWLKAHPEKVYITKNYLNKRKSYIPAALKALEELNDEEPEDVEEETEDSAEEQNAEVKEEKAKRVRLQTQRINAVYDELTKRDIKSVADLGCGNGELLSKLGNKGNFIKLIGADVSLAVLRRAAENLKRLIEIKKVTLYQSSALYKDARLKGTDAVCALELIEHIDSGKLPLFETMLFEELAPDTVIITTPNAEYNVNYEFIKDGNLRHGDHRFEWTRKEFSDWTQSIASKYNYSCSITGIGEEDEQNGCPTQMGVFEKCE